MLGPYTPRQIVEILEIFEDNSNELRWSIEDGRIAGFYVLCNDTFYWATADAEKIEPEDIQDLIKAKNDAQDDYFWPLVWITRKRKLRPQGALLNKEYMKKHRLVIELLLEAAPEREVDWANPQPWKGFDGGV